MEKTDYFYSRKMSNSNYQDRAWLFEQYIEKGLSIGKIAKRVEKSDQTIYYWLKKFEIPRRSLSEAYKNKLEKGFKVWNKGISPSKETRERISKTLKEKLNTPEYKELFSKKYKGKNNPFYGKKHLKETIKKISESEKGEKHWHWQGGKSIKGEYIIKKKYGHYRADGGNYVREHLLVMEAYLKRPVWEWEVVHHINGKKSDNKIENLYLCKNNKEHGKIHKQLTISTYKLIQSQRFGKIKFNKEEGNYYIEYLEKKEN